MIIVARYNIQDFPIEFCKGYILRVAMFTCRISSVSARARGNAATYLGPMCTR